MAAVTTRQGNPHEYLDDATAEYADCAAGVARDVPGPGLGRMEAEVCPTPGEVIGGNHAGLVELAWARKLVQDASRGLSFRVVPSGRFTYEDESDEEDAPAGLQGLGECPPGCVPAPATQVSDVRGRVSFEIEVVDKNGRPAFIPSDSVPWSPMSSASGLRATPLLSWTSKMGCWSWSLPAGHDTIGGACPGAAAGQSTSSAKARDNQGKVVLQVLNGHPSLDANTGAASGRVPGVDLAAAVCQTCYATGANYKYSDNVGRSYLRWVWMEWALKQPGAAGFSNLFVQTMVAAIAGADDALDGTRHTSGKKRGQWKDLPEPARWRDSGWRFFRIHDSGDFPSEACFLAWVEIATFFRRGNPNGVQPVLFWAPTRMWAMGKKWIELIRKAEALGNFRVRPSAYSLNQHAPAIEGWTAGSTVYANAIAEDAEAGLVPRYYDWDCRAYQNTDGVACRGAVAPELVDGEVLEGPEGCRACWVFPQLRINYRAH